MEARLCWRVRLAATLVSIWPERGRRVGVFAIEAGVEAGWALRASFSACTFFASVAFPVVPPVYLCHADHEHPPARGRHVRDPFDLYASPPRAGGGMRVRYVQRCVVRPHCRAAFGPLLLSALHVRPSVASCSVSCQRVRWTEGACSFCPSAGAPPCVGANEGVLSCRRERPCRLLAPVHPRSAPAHTHLQACQQEEQQQRIIGRGALAGGRSPWRTCPASRGPRCRGAAPCAAARRPWCRACP